jgi:2-polyprenyl-3-methyl-5-hydroxy-6-metoxy-1,4-benzoquinol methylase
MKQKEFTRLHIIRIHRFVVWLKDKWEIIRNKRRDGVHQYSHATGADRYPTLFKAVAGLAKSSDGTVGRILSFGCSTGEECATLGEYFPGSEVVGADISPRVLRKAARRWAKIERLRFISTAELYASNQTFDVVFAMSVLCRHRDTKHSLRCDDVYPFAHFEKTVKALARLVRRGGLLVIFNSNYRFEDTAPAVQFEPIRVEDHIEDRIVNNRVRLFHPDGCVMPDQNECNFVFRRLQ